MHGLLSRAGYEPIDAEDMEATPTGGGKNVTGNGDCHGNEIPWWHCARVIDWLKAEGYRFPVLAVVDNLIAMEIIDVMCDWGAVNIIQRPAIDKMLIAMVDKYASSENVCSFLTIR